jgi:signal transduction histidine kinase
VGLADFIEQTLPAILEEWEAFAGSLLPAAADLDSRALRDHAEEMLMAVVLDLRTSQTSAMQDAKSKGHFMDVGRRVPETAAEVHAVLRATGGFSIEQLVSEYRALRASVLKLYSQQHEPGPTTLEDVGRFNEAIDQAMAESVRFYSAEVERWRNVFLGVLGHDLLGPLNAILLTSKLVAALSRDQPVGAATERLIRSGERMKELLNDLLDYNRTKLGLGIPVRRRDGLLEAICLEEVELRKTAHPGADIRFRSTGSTHGQWDTSRMRQLLGNLIANAVKYGVQGGAVDVRLTGNDTEVQLRVRNQGALQSRDALSSLFDPLRRIADVDADEDPGHLGLGLFIVREVALAHGGHVAVESNDGVTDFTVHLPRGASG